MYYEAEEFQCKSNTGRECPLETIGIGPDCLCIRANHTFYDMFWSCYADGTSFGGAFAGPQYCPDKGQKYPQCSGIDPNALKSLIG